MPFSLSLSHSLSLFLGFLELALSIKQNSSRLMNESISFLKHDFAITENKNKEANPWLSVSITNLKKVL